MPIRLFISHSSSDAPLAVAVVELIRAALNLPAEAIRCTSVDGYRLPGGARTEEQLRREVHDAEAFIGIVSVASIRSTYVLFELGARWGAGRHLLPVLAPGVGPDVLSGPISGISSLRADSPAQLHQLVGDIGRELGVAPGPPASYVTHIDRLVQIPAANVPAGIDTRVGAPRRPLNPEERDMIAGVPSDARELLIAAAGDDNGVVLVTEAMQGVSISVGDREFTTMGNARSEARWRRAVRELEQLGLIENRGGDGSLLCVTDEGFRVADLLQQPNESAV